MVAPSRRSFLAGDAGTGVTLALAGSLEAVVGARAAGAQAESGLGYGPLVRDPAGILDLPAGFHYRAFSRADVDALDGGAPVPALHDGMAAFDARQGSTWLVRNHEIEPEDVEEDGIRPVPHPEGRTYDPNGTGGTTTLLVGPGRQLLSHYVSLAGTANNCAGGPTPWGTWLTCEETDIEIDGVRHGYVFEVDPRRGGDPQPIKALGRFEHEAVSIDPRDGATYLTEDASGPFGLFYRYLPDRPLAGRGSLRAGGSLQALCIPDLAGTDLSAVRKAGTTFAVDWLPIPDRDPGPSGVPVRASVQATPIQKCEGTWWGRDSIWFVSSFGGGPDAEDEEDRSAAEHGGQIWRYDPQPRRLSLVVVFEPSSDYQGPDNITVAPHGYAVMCTDGDDDRQFLAGITGKGRAFPLARNRLSGEEFAGATFAPDGRTLFCNIQEPGHTFAIWGPWAHWR
jgi:hypothetical protein